jgi:hypothetical protein
MNDSKLFRIVALVVAVIAVSGLWLAKCKVSNRNYSNSPSNASKVIPTEGSQAPSVETPKNLDGSVIAAPMERQQQHSNTAMSFRGFLGAVPRLPTNSSAIELGQYSLALQGLSVHSNRVVALLQQVFTSHKEAMSVLLTHEPSIQTFRQRNSAFQVDPVSGFAFGYDFGFDHVLDSVSKSVHLKNTMSFTIRYYEDGQIRDFIDHVNGTFISFYTNGNLAAAQFKTDPDSDRMESRWDEQGKLTKLARDTPIKERIRVIPANVEDRGSR